jgi:hypothetical protein
VVCFENHEEAEQYLKALESRFKGFGLELAPEKTRIVKFGRRAWLESRGDQRKLSSFNFLGFTHYMLKTRKGYFSCGYKTAKTSFKCGLKKIRIWLKSLTHRETKKSWWPKLKSHLLGHYQYFGVSVNYKSLRNYANEVTKMVFTSINRRSQKKSMNWEQFNEYIKWYPLPRPRIIHKLY